MSVQYTTRSSSYTITCVTTSHSICHMAILEYIYIYTKFNHEKDEIVNLKKLHSRVDVLLRIPQIVKCYTRKN